MAMIISGRLIERISEVVWNHFLSNERILRNTDDYETFQSVTAQTRLFVLDPGHISYHST